MESGLGPVDPGSFYASSSKTLTQEVSGAGSRSGKQSALHGTAAIAGASYRQHSHNKLLAPVHGGGYIALDRSHHTRRPQKAGKKAGT